MSTDQIIKEIAIHAAAITRLTEQLNKGKKVKALTEQQIIKEKANAIVQKLVKRTTKQASQ